MAEKNDSKQKDKIFEIHYDETTIFFFFIFS